MTRDHRDQGDENDARLPAASSRQLFHDAPWSPLHVYECAHAYVVTLGKTILCQLCGAGDRS